MAERIAIQWIARYPAFVQPAPDLEIFTFANSCHASQRCTLFMAYAQLISKIHNLQQVCEIWSNVSLYPLHAFLHLLVYCNRLAGKATSREPLQFNFTQSENP